MSHFIISSKPTFSFGTPNGQASTQLLQAMQRGFRADWTTPSPVRLIASAGHTSAQVGEWQCMQTTCTVRAQVTTTIRPDVVFVPYHWAGPKSINQVTIAAQDPISKIPEYKVCAARVRRADGPPEYVTRLEPQQ